MKIYRFCMIFFALLLLAEPGFSRKHSRTCSQMWLYQNRTSRAAKLTVGTLFALPLPFLWGIPIDEALRLRNKSEMARLLISAGLMHDFRNRPDQIEEKHKNRVRKFYQKYVIRSSLTMITLSEVVETLAIYDVIAKELGQCRIFGRSKMSIAAKLFPNGTIDRAIKFTIDNFKINSPKILKDRQEDLDKWYGNKSELISPNSSDEVSLIEYSVDY